MPKKIPMVLGSIGIAILFSATFAVAQTSSFVTTLRRGASGAEVRKLQETLATMPDIYPEGLVTGYFGVATEKAVKRFQIKYNIESAGILGPMTRAKLNSLYAPHVSPSQLQLQQQKSSVQETNRAHQIQKVIPTRPATNMLPDRFVVLEKELLMAKTSGSFIAPNHYNRIQQDITVLEKSGYPVAETKRLRDLALQLAPHLNDQQQAREPIVLPPPAPPREPKPFILKNIGVSFEPWDRTTNKAGAFLFVSSENKLFFEYGAEVPSSEGGTKILPTFEYRTAVDADVFAAIDGIVTAITYQERTNDYAIHLQPEENSLWILEHDHVRNLKIAKGDIVKAGDILGKVGTLGGALGRTEIMFWNASEGHPRTYCPFKYFDPQLRAEYEQKVTQHMKDWEEFKGNTNIYAEEKHLFPGCVYETLLD